MTTASFCFYKVVVRTYVRPVQCTDPASTLKSTGWETRAKVKQLLQAGKAEMVTKCTVVC